MNILPDMKKYIYKESFLQEHFAHWLQSKNILFNASMAGVNISIPMAIRRKKMGAHRGYPDIEILEPRGKYHGLFIELKAGKSIPTPEQYEWQDELNKRGYLALIMPNNLNFSQAFNWLRDAVEEYLKK